MKQSIDEQVAQIKERMEECDIDFFINFFEGLPDEQWLVGARHRGSRRSAEGFLANTDRPAWYALTELASKMVVHFSVDPDKGQQVKSSLQIIDAINDGETIEYQQATPKERVLAALRDLKATS
jgi:hypothetical protein